MNDSVFFATFDPLYVNAPDACALCIAQPPLFTYEYCVEDSDGKREYLKGFCCAQCAQTMLKNWPSAKPENGPTKKRPWRRIILMSRTFKSGVSPLSAP